jgi:deazaflavin-dependent oxidoreductase (nitroreductase family)
MSRPTNFNQQIITAFRANGGIMTSGPFANGDLLLLTTTGAKSGQPRTNPLVYFKDGDRIIIVASKAGAPTNPDWYYNLVAHSLVTIEVGTEAYQVQASIAEGAERERLYAAIVAQSPGFGEYQRKTTRQIPIIILTRADAA